MNKPAFEFCAAARAEATPSTPVIFKHAYSLFTMEYVLSGHGFLELEGKKYELGPEDVYMLPIGPDHAYWPDRSDPWHKIFYTVCGALVPEFLRLHGLQSVYTFERCAKVLPFFEKFLLLPSGNLESRAPAALLFHSLIAELANLRKEQTSVFPQKIRILKDALDRTLRIKFSLKAFAEEIGCSETYLIAAFRKSFGITPYEYLLNGRLESARYLLHGTALSIKEIAGEFCFTDQYHFSNTFRNRFGIPPTKYRKNHLGSS